MNAIVTGATGFIGSNLCETLVQKGYNVIGLTHSGRTNNIKQLLHEREFNLQKGDIRDINFVRNIIKNKDIDIIFHLAAQLPQKDDMENPFLCFEVNVKGTLNLLNVAYLEGLDKFIYGSTMSVYSAPPIYLPVDEKHPVEPSTIYSASKLAGELYCKVYSNAMNIGILRYSGVYGKGQSGHNAIPRFIKQALKNMPITIYGNGNQSSDFAYVKDIVEATILASNKNESGIYNIGSGGGMSIIELAKRIIKFTNSKSEIVFTDKATDRPFQFFYNIEKSKKALGYSPISFDEGLSRYMAELDIGNLK